jgi:hypothetical protein
MTSSPIKLDNDDNNNNNDIYENIIKQQEQHVKLEADEQLKPIETSTPQLEILNKDKSTTSIFTDSNTPIVYSTTKTTTTTYSYVHQTNPLKPSPSPTSSSSPTKQQQQQQQQQQTKLNYYCYYYNNHPYTNKLSLNKTRTIIDDILNDLNNDGDEIIEIHEDAVPLIQLTKYTTTTTKRTTYYPNYYLIQPTSYCYYNYY